MLKSFLKLTSIVFYCNSTLNKEYVIKIKCPIFLSDFLGNTRTNQILSNALLAFIIDLMLKVDLCNRNYLLCILVSNFCYYSYLKSTEQPVTFLRKVYCTLYISILGFIYIAYLRTESPH